MANEVKLTIRVGDDGSLNVIAKKAKEAAKATDGLAQSTDKANKSRNNYNKTEKGVGQLTNNSTKAFSKQASVIGSGLVPAYATLAANVFAITAAFNALKRADAFRLLEEGLNKVGAAAGRNLPYVADRLKDITGQAISTQQAMEAVALGTSSGFSQQQLEGLAKVARGASTALGRDLGDAMSRLTRGAAKLEPEILDELGIMVRLDDATTTYAASLGKTADQLSIIERRQAFTNAILEQGLQKYGALAESVEPSPYDQLAAAFDSLSKSLLQLINGALTPALNLLSGNKGALIGATVLFGTTISRQMVPALYEGAKAAAEQADALAEQAEKTQGSIKTTGNLPKVYRTLSKSIQEGTATQGDYTKALTSLDKSLGLHGSQLQGLQKEHDAESEKIKVKKAKIAEVTAARATLINTMALQRGASSRIAAANAIEAASTLNLKLAYTNLKLSIQEYAAAQSLAALAAGKTVGIFGKLRKGVFALSLSFRVLGTALLSAIPIIGQAILIGSLLWELLKGLWPETDKVTQATDKAIDSLSSLGDAYDDLQQRLQKGGVQPIIEEATTLTGVYTDIAARIKEITAEIDAPDNEELNRAVEKANELRAIVTAGDDRGGNYFTRLFSGESLTTFFKSDAGVRASLDYYEDKIERLSKKPKVPSPVGEEAAAELKRFVGETITSLTQFGDSTKDARAILEAFLKAPVEDLTSSQIQAIFDSLGPEVKALTNAITNSEDAFSKFRTETAKYEKKALTPFDGIIDQAIVLRDTFNTLTDEQATALAKKLPEAFRKTFGGSKAAVNAFVQELEKNQKILLETPGAIQKNEFALAKLNKVRNQSSLGLSAAIDLENEITRQKIKQLNAEHALIDLTTGSVEDRARALEIEREVAALKENIVEDEVKAAEVAVVAVQEKQKLLGIEQRIASSKRAQFESEAKMRRLQQVQINLRDKLTRDPSVTAKQERDIFEKERETRIKLANEENALKLKAIEMEYDLLEAQASLLKERLKAAGVSTESIDKYIANLGTAEEAAVAAQEAAGQAALEQIKNQGLQNNQNVQDTVLEAANTGGTTFERAVGVTREGGLSELDTMNEKIQAMRSMVSPMLEDLSRLGPEGDIAAAVSQGAFAIADSFTYAFEMSGTNMEKMGAKAQAIADTIGAVNSIMQASMQASIAKIDQQIAAEKKRDGKSAQSVAKIAALEKKKEAQAKKAFEINKKMLMAQTIANTAAGVMATMRDTGFFGSPLAMIVAAMGAAQLAIIAGTSYQGGGSAPSTSGPTSISLGQRKNSVDLAKSQSARGELAYFRGESGIGGPENFKNAFAGYKNRAEGGNTAYMVGEQGPELFVPEMPGRIVANDDIAPAAPTNVSFNINTVDATGVEDLLVAQRGNIIGMIRQAANSYGQDFVEDVDTSVFTQSAGGVNRY